MIRFAFVTVTDSDYFPGTLATVNSLLEFHPRAEVLIVNNLRRSLTPAQMSCFSSQENVRILDSDAFQGKDRYINAWELKSYAAADLADSYDLLILIDSDCLLCAPVTDQIEACQASRDFRGGQDGEGVDYDDRYRIYGISTPVRNDKYMSTSLCFMSLDEAHRRVLRRWAECCNEAEFNGRGPYPGYGDQGVLNALLFAENRSDRVHLLENALWSQHWVHWDSIIEFENGHLVNRTAGNRRQRSFHSVKYWTPDYRRQVLDRGPQHSTAYSWFLALLWFGPSSNWNLDPRSYLPDASQHLIEDLALFLPQVLQLYPAAREKWTEFTSPLLDRLLKGKSPSPTAGNGGGPTSRSRNGTRRLILESYLSPGDILTLTASVRDLHLTHPGRFETDVRTPCPALWENNPYLSPLQDDDPRVERVKCEYPLVHHSNQRPYHMLHGYRRFLAERLGVEIVPHEFKGDIHLSDLEKSWMSQVEEIEGLGARFWIIVSGGKWDFTAKWWDPSRAQQVVDHFRGRIRFVQVGEAGHHHPLLHGVINLVGRTDLRQLVRLVYHADGVVCPVTMLMHLAAAVETRPSRPPNRPCVVIAGGREPSHWEAYPHHRFLHTMGALPCCDNGGCWKSRVEPLGDGDEKDRSLCLRPVTQPSGLKLPECLEMITAQDVIRAIEQYLAYDLCLQEKKHATGN